MERRFFAEGRPTSIIKRMIDPAEVAALVAYVCSARASATTGAALRVGRHCERHPYWLLDQGELRWPVLIPCPSIPRPS